MWNNLIQYADPEGPGLITVVPPNFHNSGIPDRTFTLSGTNALGFPEARQQAAALDNLFGWYIGHNGRQPPAMTSEPSIQDEVHAQIIEPLNMLLQVWCWSLETKFY